MEPRIEPLPVDPTYHVTATLVGDNEFEFSGDVQWDPVLGKHIIKVLVPSTIELALKNATFQPDPLFWKKKDCGGSIDVVLVDPNCTRIGIKPECKSERVGAFSLCYVAADGKAGVGGDPTIINADTPPQEKATAPPR